MPASTDPDSRLEILLLGPPVIQYMGQPYQVSRRMLRGMLFFLAVENRLISRNRLILTFWPEASDEDGRRHLRESLSKLRKSLPDENALIVEHDGIRLNSDLVYVDVQQYQSHLSNPRRMLHSLTNRLLPATVVGDITAAIDLWRAPRFLAGMNLPESSEFQTWQSVKAQEIESSAMVYINCLVDHYMEAKNYIQAILYSRKGLLIDELDIALRQKQIECMLALGRVGDALSSLEQLKQQYEEEGSGELPVSLLNLEKRIRCETTDDTRRDPAKWLEPIDLHTPFVGRQELLQSIKSDYDHGGTVFLKGEAGSGKTRTAYEVYNRLSPPPRLILVSGKPGDRNKPFQAWVDLMRRNLTDADWRKLEPVWIRQLVNLMPELVEFLPESSAADGTVAYKDGHTSIFEAIRRLIMILIGENDLFICLDDAQWFDSASIEVNTYLFAHERAPSKGLILITSRLEEENRALADLEIFCVQRHRAKTLTLEALTTEDVRDLTVAMLDFYPAERLVRKLLLDTGGNPLLLSETLKSMTALDKKPRKLNRIESLPVAPSIQTLLRQRLQLLNRDVKNFMQSAALLGRQFLVADVAHVADMKLESAVDAVEELQRINLVRPLAHPLLAADYSFIHDKIRETIVSGISLARKKLLHLKAGRFLEEKYHSSFDMASTIALHYEEAGEITSACYFWLKAAVYANQKLSPELALSACRNAERLLFANSSLIPQDSILHLYDILGQVHYMERNVEGMQYDAGKLIEFGQRREAPQLLVAGYSLLANLETLLIRPMKAVEHLKKAGTFIEQVQDPFVLSQYYNRRGLAYQLMLDLEHAEQDYSQSLEHCANVSRQEVVAARIDVHSKLAFLSYFKGEPKTVLEHARAALDDCKAVGDVEKGVWAHFMTSAAQLDSGNNTAAVQAAREGLTITDAYRSHQFAGYLRTALGRAQFLLGEIDNGIELLFSVMREAEGILTDVQVETYLALIQSYQLMAAWQPAFNLAQMGWLKFEDQLQRPLFLAFMGLHRTYMGEPVKGQQEVEQAVAVIEQMRYIPALITARLVRGIVRSRLADWTSALSDLQWVYEESSSRGYWSYYAMACKAIGEVMLVKGQAEAAYEYAVRFAQQARQTRNPWYETLSLLLKNKVMRVMGENDPALFNRLQTLFRELDKKCIRPELVKFFSYYKSEIIKNF